MWEAGCTRRFGAANGMTNRSSETDSAALLTSGNPLDRSTKGSSRQSPPQRENQTAFIRIIEALLSLPHIGRSDDMGAHPVRCPAPAARNG
jgi:hypothetical protein